MQKYGGAVILMSSVEYLVGNENILNTPLSVFNDKAISFLNDISQELLKSEKSRIYPDLSAFAFWCRKANLNKLKDNYSIIDRLGRGLCFHISPSNIPINFAFSYVFSLLAGNSNIVRLPSKSFPQVDFLCEIFNNVLKKYPEIEKRTAFIKYPVNNEITADFSRIADARMIWGGDVTIASVKCLETKPRCVDITFADRYSVCIIDAEKIQEADDTQLKRLSEDFYNDTYLMDQNACSSPQLILWVNDNDDARLKFWAAIYNMASKKYNLQDAVCVDKYTKLCEDAIDFGIVGQVKHDDNLLYRAELSELTPKIEELRGKSGYFYEFSLKNYDELFDVITERFQTITYFGIDAEILRESIITHSLRGVDRIVPIGKAMDISAIWDGHDLVSELSRRVSLI